MVNKRRAEAEGQPTAQNIADAGASVSIEQAKERLRGFELRFISDRVEYGHAIDALIAAVRAESNEKDQGAGLIGQPIPDVEGTEPRPNGGAQLTCICGNGWTFDFANSRVYCRKCNSSAVESGQ